MPDEVFEEQPVEATAPDRLSVFQTDMLEDALGDDPGVAVMAAARVLAVGMLSRQKGISRREARNKIGEVQEGQVWERARESGLVFDASKVRSSGGAIQWIREHWDLIEKIAKFILSIAVLL